MANRSLNRLILGILFLFAFGYTIFVFRFYLEKPSIELSHLDYIVTNTPLVTISGDTTNVHTLFINSVPIFVDKDGKFTQTRSITTGISTVTLTATDRFERSIDKIVTIERKPAYTPPPIEIEEIDIEDEDELTEEDSELEIEETDEIETESEEIE